MAVTYSESLNFDDGIRLVKINEAGDTAAISTNDTTFVERFVDFINWLESAADKLQKQEFPKQTIEGELDIDALYKFAKNRTEICKKACEMLDGLFGDGVCAKAFGVDIPDENCILDFVEQMVPFVNRAFGERGEKIAMKYDRNRKGGRTQRSKAELIADYKAEHGE